MEEPRDELIGSTSSLMPDQTVPATSAPIDQTGTDGAAAEEHVKTTTETLSESAAKVAKTLKPVAEVAESIAGQAVSLSAKGINWLDATLTERRQQRTESSAESDTTSPGDSA